MQKSWFYRTFICGHWFSGQIKSTRNEYTKRHFVKVRHYRECQKCGKKVWID